jgi:NAD(P)-dependent dehydrogenase (short-subunit alcohol dehydrogenase family)
MGGRVALVTGATGAIGGAIAEGLAREGLRVVIASRDHKRGRDRAAHIARATGNANLTAVTVDLADRESVRSLVDAWTGDLHVLVNNAADTPRERSLTAAGIEVQWATNVLAYLWMMEGFAPVLEQSKPARIVNVASYWAGGLDLDDPQFERRPYDNDTAYRQSKQADRMLSKAMASRLPAGITVNACHPGDVPSRLARSLGFDGHQSAEEAAATPLLLATSSELESVSGRYFEHGKETPCRFSTNTAAVDALYRECKR